MHTQIQNKDAYQYNFMSGFFHRGILAAYWKISSSDIRAIYTDSWREAQEAISFDNQS